MRYLIRALIVVVLVASIVVLAPLVVAAWIVGKATDV